MSTTSFMRSLLSLSHDYWQHKLLEAIGSEFCNLAYLYPLILQTYAISVTWEIRFFKRLDLNTLWDFINFSARHLGPTHRKGLIVILFQILSNNIREIINHKRNLISSAEAGNWFSISLKSGGTDMQPEGLYGGHWFSVTDILGSVPGTLILQQNNVDR